LNNFEHNITHITKSSKFSYIFIINLTGKNRVLTDNALENNFRIKTKLEFNFINI